MPAFDKVLLFSGYMYAAEEGQFDELQSLVSQLFLESPPFEHMLKGNFLAKYPVMLFVLKSFV
jgi:hypothetical protein